MARSLPVVLIAIAALLFASTASADTPAPLIGEWEAVAVERSGRPSSSINFAGMRWVFVTDDTFELYAGGTTPAGLAKKPPLKCTYERGDNEEPKHFAWTMHSAQGESTKTVKAIYELKGDVLSVCFAHGGDERPGSFETAGSNRTVYRFRRNRGE